MKRAPKASLSRKVLSLDRPEQVPEPTVLDDAAKARKYLYRALNERGATIRVRPTDSAVLFTMQVEHVELRGENLVVDWRYVFPAAGPDGKPAPTPLPEPELDCTWMVFAGNRGILMFHAPVVSAAEGRITFRQPAKIVYCQKRGDYRYEIPHGYEITANFSKPREGGTRSGGFTRARIHDLSATGLSLIILSDDRSRYPEGLWMTVSFRVRDREINARCEVVATNLLPPTLRVRTRSRDALAMLRVRFIRLQPSTQDFLRMYVVEHLLQYDRYRNS